MEAFVPISRGTQQLSIIIVRRSDKICLNSWDRELSMTRTTKGSKNSYLYDSSNDQDTMN